MSMEMLLFSTNKWNWWLSSFGGVAKIEIAK
jgi:hypothetical protein